MLPIALPAIWLIVLIVGLPQLSETVYTPSLPEIARALHTSEALVEYTLTIYLAGFAIGTLFWGKLSDKIGRKFCVIAGLLIFMIGCIACYFSYSIEMLMIARLIQSFGGSIGSVVGQAICRDAFHGAALSRVYSIVGSALSLFPALGPLCGGLIAEWFGFTNIFLFLLIFAVVVMFCVMMRLPETHPHLSRVKNSLLSIASSLVRDRRVLGFGLIVAGCNGITFSYFAEGPFYLINGLGLSPTKYGLSFVLVAFATTLGGIASRKLHNYRNSQRIMGYGLYLIVLGALNMSIGAALLYNYLLSDAVMLVIAVLSQIVVAFGICMATSNALALALVDYKHTIGTASSLFGFFYYCLISFFTFVMGWLHNGTLLPMPLYFLGLGCLMLVVNGFLLEERS